MGSTALAANIFIYVIVFFMGTLFGSFLTLATFRIPLNKDITHERSFCPTCNHRLEFLDLIPVFSYIFLGGKCRYCKSKIGPRYFILEICSGLLFLAIAAKVDLTVFSNIGTWLEFAVLGLFIVFLLLVATMDKEHDYIDMKVIAYGTVVSLLYVLQGYYFKENFNLYRVLVFYGLNLILVIINTKGIKKQNKYDYVTKLLIVLNYIFMIFGLEFGTLGVIFTLLIYSMMLFVNNLFNTTKVKNNYEHINNGKPVKKYIDGKGSLKDNLPIAYYLVFSTLSVYSLIILTIVITNCIFGG